MNTLNKAKFSKIIESLRFVVNDSHGATGSKEKYCADRSICIRLNDLYHAIDGCQLNAHAKKLLPDAKQLITREKKYSFELEKAYTSIGKRG